MELNFLVCENISGLPTSLTADREIKKFTDK